MKKSLLLLLLVVIGWSARAQNYNAVRRMEYEAGIGVIQGHRMYGAPARGGMQLYLEVRMNVVDTPFDVGVQGALSFFGRATKNSDDFDQEIRGRGAIIALVDYNFRRWKRVAPFVGVGIGMAAIDSKFLSGDHPDTYIDRSFVFNPRIGVELFSHLRITAEYKWMHKEYSYFGLNLGVVLGGGRRK